MLIACPCRPLGRFSCLISYLSGQTFLELQEVILAYQPALLQPSSPQDFMPQHSSKQSPKEMEMAFCVIQGCGLDFCLPISFQDLPSTTLQSLQPRQPLTFMFPNSFSTFFKYQTWLSTFPSWLPHYVFQEVAMHSRSILDYLSPAGLSFQEILRGLRLPLRTRGCDF